MDYEQKLAEWLENIANVASENVPNFVEQYCKYTIVSNSLTIFFITAMLTFLLYIFKKLISSKDSDILDLGKGLGAITFGLGFLSIPYAICLCQEMIMAYLCPVMHVIKSLK